MDVNWCIANLELATEYFKERQSDHANWESGLDSLRKNKKELDEVYWQIKGLIKQFNKYYSEALSTKNDLESLAEERKRGAVSEELALQRESQLRTRLTQAFQNLIESHEEIKNKIPTISKGILEQIDGLNISAQRLYDEGKYSEAIEKWKEVLNIDPKNQTAIEGIKKTNTIIEEEKKKKEEEKKTPTGTIKKYCPRCGNTNERRLKFCNKCGASLFGT